MIHEDANLELAQQRVMEFTSMSETPEELYFNGQQATKEQVDHFLSKRTSKFEYEITSISYGLAGCSMYIIATQMFAKKDENTCPSCGKHADSVFLQNVGECQVCHFM